MVYINILGFVGIWGRDVYMFVVNIFWGFVGNGRNVRKLEVENNILVFNK